MTEQSAPTPPFRFVDAPENFYLGRRLDPETREPLNMPVYYDSADLTTHGVILGMTGSGKSGLAMTLLEEAALDGIPQIIIDIKGDMSNLLLAFPEFSGKHFAPWLPPRTQAEHPSEQQASAVAEAWRSGLTEWGITPDRVQRFRRSAQFSIYTPGAMAGQPISVLASFHAPEDGWAGNEDRYRRKLSGIVSAILGLIGINAEPLEDPEHVLLANIFEFNWSQGRDMSIERLIQQVQNPPFDKLGTMNVDSVISPSKRQKLAIQINNIVAAPTFQSWIDGEPLNIANLLYTPEGHPRISIFYLAHLDNDQQQFILTLLLESILAWMYTLSGAPKLRALLYIDEVYGLFPPAPYNPPAKDPIMRLLKQARSLGVGLLMATQNAKDLDYKGLSNAGTWFVGKLLTDHDKDRVMEGIEAADDKDTPLNVQHIRKLLGQLDPRQFIRYNIHDEDEVILMKSRRTMSYLRGPLNLQQVGQLMEPVVSHTNGHAGSIAPQASASRSQQVIAPQRAARKRTFSGRRLRMGNQPSTAPLTSAEAPEGFSSVKPAISGAIPEYYLPVEFTAGQMLDRMARARGQQTPLLAGADYLMYQPSLLGQVNVYYRHNKTDSSLQLWYAFILPTLPDVPLIEWGDYLDQPFDPNTLANIPDADAFYGDVPAALHQKSAFNDLEKSMVDWVYRNLYLETEHNPALNMYRGLNEDLQAFMGRVQAHARMKRDDEIDALIEKYDRKYDSLEKQIQRKRSRIESEEEELEARKQEELLSGAESAWRLLRGSVYRTISRVGQLRRQTSQSDERIEVLAEDLNHLLDEVDETEAEMTRDLQAIRDRWGQAAREIELVPVTPYKKDITTVVFGIGWVPYWLAETETGPSIVPASSSTIVEDQRVTELN